MRCVARLIAVAALAAGVVACEADAPPSTPAPPTAAPSPAPPPASPTPAETPDDQAGEPAPLSEVDVTLTPVADADSPTAATVAPDGTMLIAERAGTVHPLTDDGLGGPVLDVSDETTVDVERGLLGLALHPEGDRLIASFTDANGDSVVASFGWDGQAADPDDRATLFEQAQPYANHNGGGVAIGPDDALYVGMGDGGASGDPLEAGQDRSTPLGALLRLHPDTGAALDDNPFVDEEGADPRVWAYGLRNPWRFAFDPETDALYIADVGQSSREEVNWVPAGDGAGANFGWNLMEGTTQFAGPAPDGHVPPIHEYQTNAEGCAITGGPVYRGDAVPGLAGAYVFSDYCAGGLRTLRHEEGEVTEVAEIHDADMQVVSIAEDADGELYLLTFDDGVVRVDPR